MVLVRIVYTSELAVIDGHVRLAYPTVVAPRYATATGTDPLEALRDAHALNPPHLLQVPYGLTLDVEIALNRPIRSIQSPSHAVASKELAEHEYRVCLSAGLTQMDREIVLDLNLGEEAEPKAESMIGADGRAYVAVTFIPQMEEPSEAQSSEVIFILDCSGSMQGSSIAQAKTALDLCLRHLSAGDRFNICRFGSTFEWLSPEPLAYSQETLERAVSYVGRIQADLGGTELYQPLDSFLSRRPAGAASRQVILLTDGQISNEPAVIELARRHRGINRFFTFGIGPASSQHLVRGLAEATRGAAEFITEGERIEERVLRTFSRLSTPAMTDLVVRWDKARGVEQAPSEVPPIFDGDALTVYARFATQSTPAQVALKCMTPAGPLEWTVPVPAPAAKQSAIPLLWARRTIQSQEEAAEGDSRIRQRCIDLSREFGLLCGYTGFVAIEHRSVEERNNGMPASRRVPVQIPRGWHGIELSDTDALPAILEGCALDDEVGEVSLGFCTRTAVGYLLDSLSGIPRLSGSAPLDSLPSARECSDLTRLLGQQQADGSFDVPDDLQMPGWAEVVRDVREWAARSAAPESLTPERVIVTLAALILLHRDFSSEQAVWRRAGDKASRYLAQALSMTRSAVRTQVAQLARQT
jgi:Ca-activated chloride channel family protein